MGYYSPNLSHPAFAAQYPSGKPSGQDNIYHNVGFFVNANTMWDNKYFLDLIYRYEVRRSSVRTRASPRSGVWVAVGTCTTRSL